MQNGDISNRALPRVAVDVEVFLTTKKIRKSIERSVAQRLFNFRSNNMVEYDAVSLNVAAWKYFEAALDRVSIQLLFNDAGDYAKYIPLFEHFTVQTHIVVDKEDLTLRVEEGFYMYVITNKLGPGHVKHAFKWMDSIDAVSLFRSFV